MSLVTRCPKCQSDFLVSLEQLRVHDGLVRCGSCTHIFDGNAALESQLPVLTQRAEQSATANRVPNRLSPQVSPPESSPPSVLRRRSQTDSEFESLTQTPAIAQDPIWVREPTLDREPTLNPDPVLRVQGESRLRDESWPSVGRATPEFLIDETPLDGLRRALWMVLAVLAAALLVIQLAYVYRNELVTRMPSLLPMARLVCAQIKCEVTFVRQLERITIESTALEQTAAGQADGQSNHLMLKFSMRNRNDKIQPWPHLSVELKDASGTVVIRKVLTPELYLPESMATKPFGAMQEIHLSVPIVVSNLQISGVQLNRFFP